MLLIDMLLTLFACWLLSVPSRCHDPRVTHTDQANQQTSTPVYTQTRVYTCVRLLWFVGCLTYQQHASVSQGRICSNNFTCCLTEIEVADPTFYLTQSQYTDTGPTSPSADPITPGAWQGSHWSASFEVTGMTRPRKKSRRKRDLNPGSSALEEDALPLGQRGGSCVRTDRVREVALRKGQTPWSCVL